jgi:CubicO group peptidase (beta-lactamase class C family)
MSGATHRAGTDRQERAVTDSGFSHDGLTRLHDVMSTHVEQGTMPGLITLVARHGEPHVDVIGSKALGAGEPLQRNAIFRIASLSKPIGALAAMILVDDGTLRLDADVDEWLPELADRQVLRAVAGDLDDTVPATRPITVDDLLSCRLGFGILMTPDSYPIHGAVSDRELRVFGPPWPPSPHTPAEWIRDFAELPLLYQPGEKWMYNTGIQVLGVLLERAAGQPLEALLRDRIFAPLGMGDTGFSVPPEQLARLTTAYLPDPESGALSVLDAPDDSYWSAPPAFPDLSGWLVSTIDDYWAFVRLLRGRGRHDGERIVSETAIDLMTSDRITASQRAGSELFLGAHGSWGYGMAAPVASLTTSDIPRGFGWEGGTGTTWRTDPSTGLTCILFTQRAMNSPAPPEAFLDFWRCAYDAIDTPQP